MRARFYVKRASCRHDERRRSYGQWRRHIRRLVPGDVRRDCPFLKRPGGFPKSFYARFTYRRAPRPATVNPDSRRHGRFWISRVGTIRARIVGDENS